MAINLSRNTRVWLSTVTSGHNNSNTFEIPVQDGYTLSQSTSTQDITVEETGATPSRGSARFNSSLDPVEWAFTTYTCPYIGADSNHYLVDMLLWHGLADAAAPDLENAASNVHGTATEFNCSFAGNGAHVLTKLYLYFQIDNVVYLVKDVQVGQAEISVDISDLAQVAWSGSGTTYEKITAPAFIAGGAGSYDTDAPVSDTFVGIPSNKKYLVNKLTTISFESDVSGSNLHYSMPITSGNITINNNVTYLTPSTLAEVDQAVGSFTGTFDVSGSLEAYLKSGGAGTSGDPAGTQELLEGMLGNLNQITNTTNITINVGGPTGARISYAMPQAHIAVPTLSVEDVISTSVEFKALGTDDCLLSGDEIAITAYAS